MYNIRAETGYTTIIVKPGEDLKKRTKEIQEKFVRKLLFPPQQEVDNLSVTNRDHFQEAH
jgi:hypothetical protein